MATVRKGIQVQLSNLPGAVEVLAMSTDQQWARVAGTDGDPGWHHVSTLTTVPRVRKSQAKAENVAVTTETTDETIESDV